MGDSYTVRWTTLHPDAQGKVVSLWFSRTTADEDEMTVDDSLDLASESIKVSSGIPNVGSYDGRVPQLDFDQPTLWRVQVRASRARTDRVGCHGIRSYSERYGAAVIRELASCAVRAISPLHDPPAAQDTRAAAAAVGLLTNRPRVPATPAAVAIIVKQLAKHRPTTYEKLKKRRPQKL